MKLSEWMRDEMTQRRIRSLREAGTAIGVTHTTIQRILLDQPVGRRTVQLLADWAGIQLFELERELARDEPGIAPVQDNVVDFLSRNPELQEALARLAGQRDVPETVEWLTQGVNIVTGCRG